MSSGVYGVLAASTAEIAGRSGHQGQWCLPGVGGRVVAAAFLCCGQLGAMKCSNGRGMSQPFSVRKMGGLGARRGPCR